MTSQSAGKEPCCADMAAQLAWTCDRHEDPYDCPDAVVGYVGKFDEFGLIIHDGGTSSIGINFCPFCGVRLPNSRRDLWFDEVERRGLDPWGDDLPAELESDAWWNR